MAWSSHKSNGVDSQIDQFDAGEGHENAADAIDQKIAAQHAGRADRKYVDGLRVLANEGLLERAKLLDGALAVLAEKEDLVALTVEAAAMAGVPVSRCPRRGWSSTGAGPNRRTGNSGPSSTAPGRSSRPRPP